LSTYSRWSKDPTAASGIGITAKKTATKTHPLFTITYSLFTQKKPGTVSENSGYYMANNTASLLLYRAYPDITLP
jgi:hypothetical protein